MSHHKETIICPNCKSEASGNYCSQCGQENDLHEETFWKMIAHFFGHYFHYDNKSWQTLKVLWFSPGTLTLAYWNKQRMRYIPPISLYIFISVVYFLIAFSLPKPKATHLGNIVKTVVTDSVANTTAISIDSLHRIPSQVAEKNNALQYLEKKAKNIAANHHKSVSAYLKDKVWYTVPKLMFFMIPVLAWLLKIRFRQKAGISFVDHSIFAFHTHCFWFSIRLFSLVEITRAISVIVDITFYTVFFIYMTKALKKVYEVKPGNAALTLLSVGVSYTIILVITALVTMLTYFLLA